MEKKNEIIDIESYSNDVQEVLSDAPNWILRWGIVLLFVVVILLITGSWFFKYPEIISANMTLTGTTPPAMIVAKTNGILKELNVIDKQQVAKGAFLGVIENPASTKDMILLKEQIELFIKHPDSIVNFPFQEMKLGEVQSLYISFLRSLVNYRQFIELEYYPQKIASLDIQINKSQVHYKGIIKQNKIMEQQLLIAGKNFRRDSILKEKNILSIEDMDNAYNQYLQSQLSLTNHQSSLESEEIQLLKLQETLLDIKQQYRESKNSLESELNALCIQLINEIKTWELNYILIAPISGQVTFTTYWTENQHIIAGENVFTIIPDENKSLLGKALLPVARSGKVKVGQDVNINFVNYPNQEFGLVKGVVKNISLIPVKDNYVVEITLPQNLMTTYNKELPYMPEMQAQADIITKKMSLLERFMMPLKKIWTENIE